MNCGLVFIVILVGAIIIYVKVISFAIIYCKLLRLIYDCQIFSIIMEALVYYIYKIYWIYIFRGLGDSWISISWVFWPTNKLFSETDLKNKVSVLLEWEEDLRFKSLFCPADELQHYKLRLGIANTTETCET